MKLSHSIFVCLGLLCVVPTALAQLRPDPGASLHVSAGDLTDGVESLARQAGVNVLYAGDLLEGRTTSGVEGRLSPEEAFARLLEGTSLTFVEETGAVRLAMASPPESPGLMTAPPLASGPVKAVWTERTIRLSCPGCTYTSKVGTTLNRLGATAIEVKRRSAAFRSLAPAGDGEIASGLATTAHWQAMEFDVTELDPRLLSSFAMRDPRQNDGRVVIDVLVADSRLADAQCHRVLEQDRLHRYCGSPDQWSALRDDTGLRCSSRESDTGAFAGSRYARCASAAEWRRRDLALAKRDHGYVFAGDGFWLGTLGSGPWPDTSQVPVSGPLPQTPPPPAK